MHFIIARECTVHCCAFILKKNNKMESNCDTGFKAKTLGQFFFQSMKQYGKNIAQYIVETGKTDTYEELLIRCIRVALRLRDKGITKNDIISTCSPNHENVCVPTIASQFLGAKSANFDPNLSHLDTVQLLNLIRPRIIFVFQDSLTFMEDCLKKANLKVEIVVFGKSENYEQFSDYLVPHPQEDEFEPVSGGDEKETAMIMFSSGTTGFPKGICLSHYSFLFSGDDGDRVIFVPKQTKGVFLAYSNMYWISAVGIMVKSIENGHARVICRQFDAAATWTIIEKYKVTFIFLPPYQAVDFLNDRPDGVDTSSLDVFITGSCNVSEKLMKDLKEALPKTMIIQGYGQTEAAGMITIFNGSRPEELALQEKKPHSCGKMIKGIEWKVVDIETEKRLGPNEEGELRVKTDSVMNGYYKMDSSSVFDDEGYLKTGDIAYYDKEECFYVVDRIKEMFKYRGWHILPAVLEEVLMVHPAVKEAAVVGIPHEIDGDHPMGIVVLFDGNEDVTAQDIELFFNKRVSASQKLRAGVRIVKEMIRTSTGKIKRRALRQMILNKEL